MKEKEIITEKYPLKNSNHHVNKRKNSQYDAIDPLKICSTIAINICNLDEYFGSKIQNSPNNLCKIHNLNLEKEYLKLDVTLEQNIWPEVKFYQNDGSEKSHYPLGPSNIILNLNIIKCNNTLENYVFDKKLNQAKSFSKIDDNDEMKTVEKQLDCIKASRRLLEQKLRIALTQKLPVFRRAHVMINDFCIHHTTAIQINLFEMFNHENVITLESGNERQENVSIILFKLTSNKSCQTTKTSNVYEHKIIQTNKLYNKLYENPIMQDWLEILLNVLLQSFTIGQINTGSINMQIETKWSCKPLWKLVPRNVDHLLIQRSLRCRCNILNLLDKHVIHIKLINLSYLMFKLLTIICILEKRIIRVSHLNIIGIAYFRCYFNIIAFLETIISCSLKKKTNLFSNILIESVVAFLFLCRLPFVFFKNASISAILRTLFSLFHHKFIIKLKSSRFQKEFEEN